MSIIAYALRSWRPQWTQTFIKEESFLDPEHLPPKHKEPSRTWPVTLAILAVVVTSIHVFETFESREIQLSRIFLLLSWALAALFIAVDCPRYCPWWLLFFYSPCIAVDSFEINSARDVRGVLAVVQYVKLLLSLICVAVVLTMSFRPTSPVSGPIGAVGATPTNGERSPEDSLRLWQFLTTSWIGPVLKIGKTRQLQKEDIWKLGYGFQNGRIAASFREVRGSTMFWRLLRANAVDCCILVPIALSVLFCGICI